MSYYAELMSDIVNFVQDIVQMDMDKIILDNMRLKVKMKN